MYISNLPYFKKFHLLRNYWSGSFSWYTIHKLPVQLRNQYLVEISHNSIGCCDQGHDNENITQLSYLNSESREETHQKIFVAQTNIYYFRQLFLK